MGFYGKLALLFLLAIAVQTVPGDDTIELRGYLDGQPKHFLKITTPLFPSKPNVKVNSISHINKEQVLKIVEIVTELINYEYISEGYVEVLQTINKNFTSSQIIKFKFLKTDLKEVHQKDLKPYPELKILELNENQIEVIEGDLFDENPKLTNVSLRDNRIWFIHANAVTKLTSITSLRFLFLRNNPCIDKDYVHPFTQVNAQGIREIFGVCVINYNSVLIRSLSQSTGKGQRNDHRSEDGKKFENLWVEKINSINQHNITHLNEEILKLEKRMQEKNQAASQKEIEFNKTIKNLETSYEGKYDTFLRQRTVNDQKIEATKRQQDITDQKLEELQTKLLQMTESQKADPISEPQKSSSPTDVVLSTVTAILIFLMILMMIFFFIKRDKFIVMSKSYSLADCDMMSRNESSTTVEFDFIAGDDEKKRIKATTDDFCLQSKTEKSVPVESKAGPSRLLFDSSTTAEIQLLPPPISPRGVRPISMLNAPKIPPTIPPKHSSILKPKPKAEKSHGESYDKVWEANTEDDGYIELSEIQKIRSDAMYSVVGPKTKKK